MRVFFLWLAVWLASSSAFAGLPLIGERAWIRLEAPNLRDDGYAVGIVQAYEGDVALVEPRELVEGPGRTLYGSCNPSALSQAPYGAAEVASSSAAARIVERVPLALISDWRSGKHRFLEREQLATMFFKWRGDALGFPAARAQLAVEKSQALMLPEVAAAFELVAADVALHGPSGFPQPLDARVAALPQALASVSALLDAADFAAQEQPLLAMASEVFVERVGSLLRELVAAEPDRQAAERRWPALRAVLAQHAQWLDLPPGGDIWTE